MADRIIVVGSLNPEKEVQDRVRVLSGGGNLEPKILEIKERKEDIADRD